MGKDGLPTYGRFSDTIIVHEDFVHHISEKLDLATVARCFVQASPLIHRWKVGPGHKLAVLGLGGLGHMGIKFGVAFGSEVTLLSNCSAANRGQTDAKRRLSVTYFEFKKRLRISPKMWLLCLNHVLCNS
jgi:alcohol dehydrogenase (NADP+)